MLYPQKNEPLTPDKFFNPSREYRAVPFWAWNNKLDAEELCNQIEVLKKMGFGGVNIHSRTGMATKYLSDEFFKCVEACILKAESEDMNTWLYDEDRWPSGSAGGLVTKEHKFRERFLYISKNPPDVKPIAVYDIELNKDGTLKRSRRISVNDNAKGIKIYASIKIAEDSPWYNNQAYLNTIDPESVKKFIEVTYVEYFNKVGSYFGKEIPAIFTDEPHSPPKDMLESGFDNKPVCIPWSDNLAQTFSNAYGIDLLDIIPELIWDLPDGKISSARYQYHNHITDRFVEAYAGQIGAWCEKHGIIFTGHILGEDTLGQTHSVGDAMRSYRSFHIPGIDILADGRELNAAKQAQSVVRQYGREGMLSELYGVTNWDFDFRHHKLQGDWQAAMGVTVRVPHLSWVSMNGQAKRDYPASFNYQVPWYKEYSYVENHFARLNTALTRGRAVCKVGVIHPIESYWLHWGTKEGTENIRKQMENRFRSLTEWLLKGLIDFDFISESLLPELCPDDFKTGKYFPAGKSKYEVIIVPPVETLRTTTVNRLNRYVKNGGRVIFLGEKPLYADAAPSNLPGKLYDISEHCPFDQAEILDRIKKLRDIDIFDETGARPEYLLYQMREEEDCRWLFICHSDNPKNPDIPNKHKINIRIQGKWDLTVYNTLNGVISPVDSGFFEETTVYSSDLYDYDSILIKLSPRKSNSINKRLNPKIPDLQFVCRFNGPVNYMLEEPNVLLLDIAEYALDDGTYSEAEEILRLDDILHDRLGWTRRGNQAVQPWVCEDLSMPHKLRLRYTFESEISIKGAELALENSDTTSVYLNGKKASCTDGWYVDKCIGKQLLPEIIPGKNELELIMPYGKSSNPEAVYLLGDFGVEVEGIRSRLTKKPYKISFGDITRIGFQFYGGNLVYSLDCNLDAGKYSLKVGKYRSALLRVYIDGEDAGPLVYSPYCKAFDVKESGKHLIELKMFGCRINTFGQLHHTSHKGVWWGPSSWRTVGEEWQYEYNFWEQGILKSPEIYKLLDE